MNFTCSRTIVSTLLANGLIVGHLLAFADLTCHASECSPARASGLIAFPRFHVSRGLHMPELTKVRDPDPLRRVHNKSQLIVARVQEVVARDVSSILSLWPGGTRKEPHCDCDAQ